jgi:hypothetical protein
VTGEFRVSPSGLREAGQELLDSADQVGTAWQQLTAAVAGMGELFGDDMVSSLIAMTYGAAQEMAAESYGSAADSLAYFGQGLGLMADVYTEAEQASDETITASGGGLV